MNGEFAKFTIFKETKKKRIFKYTFQYILTRIYLIDLIIDSSNFIDLACYATKSKYKVEH